MTIAALSGASQDTLEVMFVTDWESVSIDFTDVTLVSEDTYGDEEYEEDDYEDEDEDV